MGVDAPMRRNSYTGLKKVILSSMILVPLIPFILVLGIGYLLLNDFLYVIKKAIIPFLSGIGLMEFPYFISNAVILVIAGIILVALPFVIKR